MEPRKIIRTDIAASAIAHLTLVGLIILISEVHPFHAAPPETVAVDIVTPEQVQEEIKEQEAKETAKEKPPEPTPDLKLPKLDFTDKSEAAGKPAAKQQGAPSPSPQASPEPQRSAQQEVQQQPSPPKPREADAQPQQPPPQAQPQPMAQPPLQAMPQPPKQPPPSQAMQQPQTAPPPAYQAPAPDVTVRYGVMLGLPPALPPELPKGASKDDGGDARDSIGAKLPPEIIAEFRRHLRSCAKLPAGVDPADNVQIKLRTVFATDGTLAREPILMAAPPSAKGVALVKSAMSALQSCQPYKMLPADKYGEWKVLDLPFSPKDFGGS